MKLFTTSDLALVRYLVNYKFHEITWIDYKKKWPQDEYNDEIKVYVSFEDTEDLQADINRFNNGDTTVHLTDDQWRILGIPYRVPADEHKD